MQTAQWALLFSGLSLVVAGLSLALTWHRGREQVQQQLASDRTNLLTQIVELEWSCYTRADSYRMLAGTLLIAGHEDVSRECDVLAEDMRAQAKFTNALYKQVFNTPAISRPELEELRQSLEGRRVAHRAMLEQTERQRQRFESLAREVK
jgi:hypothetical protein